MASWTLQEELFGHEIISVQPLTFRTIIYTEMSRVGVQLLVVLPVSRIIICLLSDSTHSQCLFELHLLNMNLKTA